ncbi:MAG: DUF6785 family protein [Phycisphaeraceae bacterium]
MTIRAVMLGVLLGIGISAFTFFNDAVIRHTFLISHYLPVAVFGALVVLILLINPLLRVAGVNAPLRPVELAVIAAIALAACAWPSFSFFRGFVANTAMPLHWLKVQYAWQAQDVMSYVPQGSPKVARGQLRHASEFARKIVAAQEAGGPELAHRLWARLGPEERQVLEQAATESGSTSDQTTAILAVLNAHILGPPLDGATLTERPASPDGRGQAWRNRRLLAAAFPDHVLPPPRGGSVLITDSSDAVLSPLITGGSESKGLIEAVPWSAWWPTLSLWGTAALLLGAASLCMALVVHPQWSSSELLAYPIPRFLAELTEPDPNGSALPRIARQHTFWYAAGAVMLLHTLNGLHAWFPPIPAIAQDLPLIPLGELFPTARRVHGLNSMLGSHLYLTVIAFAFFLRSNVSLSVGLSPIAFVMVGTLVIDRGGTFGRDYMGATNTNLLRFGGYLGMALMVAYFGRRYYLDVAKRAVGWGSASRAPTYAVWAGRGLVLATIGSVGAIWAAGSSLGLASVFVFMVLLAFLVMSRIVAETGLFFLQPWWMPVAVLTALLGIEAIGPTDYIVLAMASALLMGDPRTVLMPYLVTGLKLVDRTSPRANTFPARLSPYLLGMIVVGFAVSAVAALTLQYHYGTEGLGGWSQRTLPSMPFNSLSKYLLELRAGGTLDNVVVNAQGWGRLTRIAPEGDLVLWALLGLVLVVATAAAPLRLSWWPLHPVMFLVWGTGPANRFAVSFLIGWAIKKAVVRMSGATGHRKLVPIMVGVIAGELLAAFVWTGIGVVYFFSTGLPPAYYEVIP